MPQKMDPQPLLAEDRALKARSTRTQDPKLSTRKRDPMPERVEPCLALLKPKAPSDPKYFCEVKHDGYRLAVHIDQGSVRIITRGGHDWTHRFPAIAEEAASLDVDTAILDGEAVVLDGNGRSDFGALQQSLGGRGGKLSSGSAILYAFDLMYFDGHDIRAMELASRRALLVGIFAEKERAIRLSEEIEGEPADIFAAACSHGLEGIIMKDRNSPYRSGRLGDWLKIKCIQSESFLVVGYERSSAARSGIGSLLLAARKGDGWTYVGSVGTGFKEQEAMKLRELLDALTTERPSILYGGRRKNIVWVKPILVAEIEYRAWTHDGNLRHASYKGLREAQDHAHVYEIEA